MSTARCRRQNAWASWPRCSYASPPFTPFKTRICCARGDKMPRTSDTRRSKTKRGGWTPRGCSLSSGNERRDYFTQTRLSKRPTRPLTRSSRARRIFSRPDSNRRPWCPSGPARRPSHLDRHSTRLFKLTRDRPSGSVRPGRLSRWRRKPPSSRLSTRTYHLPLRRRPSRRAQSRQPPDSPYPAYRLAAAKAPVFMWVRSVEECLSGVLYPRERYLSGTRPRPTCDSAAACFLTAQIFLHFCPSWYPTLWAASRQ